MKEQVLNTVSEGVIKGRFMDLVKDNIDSSDYQEVEITTLKEDLILLCTEFQRVALFANNMRRIGRKQAFKDFLQGLPSHSSLPWNNYDICQCMNKLTGMDTELINMSDIANEYFNHIETAVNELLTIHELTTLNKLQVIG